MKMLITAFICILSFSSFAENSFDEVIKGCRDNTSNSALEVICISKQVSPERSKLCRKTSYSIKAEEVCLNMKPEIDSSIITGCREETSTNLLQVQCLSDVVPTEKAKACKKFSSNSTNESLCLKNSSKLSIELIEVCRKNTTNVVLENVCLSIVPSIQIVKACREFTTNGNVELVCIQGYKKLNKEIIEGCRKNTTNSANEIICLEDVVSPIKANICLNNTSNSSLEKLCLNMSAEMTLDIVKGCKQNTSNTILEAVCLELKVSSEVSKVCGENTRSNTAEDACLRKSVELSIEPSMSVEQSINK
jgi:hypothetical protein